MISSQRFINKAHYNLLSEVTLQTSTCVFRVYFFENKMKNCRILRRNLLSLVTSLPFLRCVCLSLQTHEQKWVGLGSNTRGSHVFVQAEYERHAQCKAILFLLSLSTLLILFISSLSKSSLWTLSIRFISSHWLVMRFKDGTAYAITNTRFASMCYYSVCS